MIFFEDENTHERRLKYLYICIYIYFFLLLYAWSKIERCARWRAEGFECSN